MSEFVVILRFGSSLTELNTDIYHAGSFHVPPLLDRVGGWKGLVKKCPNYPRLMSKSDLIVTFNMLAISKLAPKHNEWEWGLSRGIVSKCLIVVSNLLFSALLK